MEERRKFIRLPARLKANCWQLGTEEPLGSSTRNVSGGGMSLITKARVAPGTVLGIEVHFPGRVAPVRFTGQVTWSGELILPEGERGPPQFETGIRFLDIAPEDRALLLQAASRQPSPPGPSTRPADRAEEPGP
jgi:hypothetical protein